MKIIEETGPNDDDYELTYRKAMLSEVFCKGWMNRDVKMFSIDFNIFNVATGIFMDAKIVFVETDQGTYYIEVDTNRFTTNVGFDRTSKILLVWFGFLANLINMIVTCRKIKSERIQERMFEAYKDQDDDAADAKKEAEDPEDEDFEENEFDLTDGEY